MENQSAVLIPLLTDASINANNSTTTVVGPALNFLHRAKSVQAFIETYDINGTNARVEVFGDWSIDKVNWKPFAAAVTDTAVTAEGLEAKIPYEDTNDFGPFVRFRVTFYSADAGLFNGSIVLNVRFFG